MVRRPDGRMRAAGRLTAALVLSGGVLLGLAGAAHAAPTPAQAAAPAPAASALARQTELLLATQPAAELLVAAQPAARLLVATQPAAGLLVATVPAAGLPAAVKQPISPTAPADPSNSVTVSVPGQQSEALQIILLVTVLGVAPAILLLCTSFTKIVVVLSLTRSALGTPSIPPNQVLVGLALFLSLFIMGPTIDQIQSQAIKPYTSGSITVTQAYRKATAPLQSFMLKQTRPEELALMDKAAGESMPANLNDVDLRTLVPAFVLSELRGAFIIGFVIFIPFLVIDIVVAAILMSLGMVMLPPSLVSLPFKLLLFVLVDGWTLIITTLIGSYHH